MTMTPENTTTVDTVGATSSTIPPLSFTDSTSLPATTFTTTEASATTGSYLDLTTSSSRRYLTLPPELFRTVARWSDPISARNLRPTRKAIRHAILPSDIVYAGACWSLYYLGFTTCWEWAAKNNHVDVISTLLLTGEPVNLETLLATSIEKGFREMVDVALIHLGVVWFWKHPAFISRSLQSCLVMACTVGNIAAVRLLVQYGAQIHADNTYDEDALEIAVRNHQTEIVKLLLEGGADVSRRQYLMIACGHSNLDIVRLLVEAGADVNAPSGRPIVDASCFGRTDVVNLLLHLGAYPAHHALASAAWKGHVEIVRRLLAAGIPVDACDSAALQFAVSNGDTLVTEVLLQAGADIHAKDDEAIIEAARLLYVGMVKFLVEAGANVCARDDEALMNAVKWGDAEMVKCLLEAGSDVHARSEQALIDAAGNGYTDIVAALIAAGANVTTRMDDFVARAAKGGHLGVVQMLLEAGNNVHTGLEEALANASERGYVEIVRILLEAGANVDAAITKAVGTPDRMASVSVLRVLLEAGKGLYADTLLQRALEKATESGWPNAVRLLLESGAGVTEKALTNAAKGGYEDAVRLLLQARFERSRPLEMEDALVAAAEMGFERIERYLVEAGADVRKLESVEGGGGRGC
ncbi:hypothetical protein HDV00_007986 [Rhizophlyctis rosea]|nr:hypothetical protein HDV00_007986 [Rhizophlyctis rosea]